MFKKLTVNASLCLAMFFTQPAFAYENYVDGAITIEEVLDLTLQNHVDKPELDTLVDGAVQGIVQSLNDPYSEYMTEESLKEFSDALNGDYVGIGISIQMKGDYPLIEEVFKNSPAELADLKAGDLIVAVNGESTYQIPLSMISLQIRGKEGSTVQLTIQRDDQKFDVELTRSNVDLPTVEAEVKFGNIGYVDVNSFGVDTAFEFSDALKKLQSENVEGIILDLRDDPGGYLMAAVRMAGEFLPSGKKVVAMVDRSGEQRVYKTFGSGSAAGLPVVVLVDSNTASAAEILSGALQDYQAATLVGSQTYGKGTVQTVFDLTNGGALKLTIAKYQLPGGRFIDGVGITPDKQVLTPGAELYAARKLLQPNAETVIQYTLGKNTVNVNGDELPILSSAYQKNNMYYLPLRTTMEIFGYEVNWDIERDGIKLTDGSEQKIISSADDTLELVDGSSYISVDNLTKLGFNCQVKEGVVRVSQH